MAVKECKQVPAIVVDADTLRFGGSAFVRERTCEVECTIHWGSACTDYWEHELSCGHTVETLDKEPPIFCLECGAKVVD